MHDFFGALTSGVKNTAIPEEHNYFGKLIGDWRFDWIDHHTPRTVKGEWHFSWVLEGAAVQDVFICPSRDTRDENPQPDGEYGTTFRVYNPNTTAWDIAYCCTGRITRLEARKQGDRIVLTNIDYDKEKWVFAEIEDDYFHWQNVTVKDNGEWYVNADLYAKRII